VTSVEDLLLAADAARLSGHPADAVGYLEQLLSAHPNDSRAAAAAFTAGRLYLGLQRFAEAAAAFEKTLSLDPDSALHENALARSVEAYAKAGDSVVAERNAKLYLERYPNGTWVNAVKTFGKARE
jgi:transmembrane sensor